MRKTHHTYLKRSIGIAINLRASDTILTHITHMRSGNVPIYGLIRDIVSDIRFYSVTENDDFWRLYCLHSVSHFIDSLNYDDWIDTEQLTGKKEDFLNEWFANHLFFLEDDEKKKKLKEISSSNRHRDKSQSNDDDDDESEENSSDEPNKIDDRVYDCSNIGDVKSSDTKHLPDDLKDYLYDSEKDNNEGSTEGPTHGYGQSVPHTAEARFMKNIDPSIVRLAEMIGRSGEYDVEITGKFLHSGKSDISGVTIGNDLNSLLPSELVMLADKRTENVFYRKYTQNRLQTFASASHSFSKGESKCGPIFLCLDTSSSMSGKPEIMAKTLALAIAIVAQRKHRPLILFNYSYTVSFFVLQSLRRQKKKLLKVLSTSYGGGNDENILFKFALKGIYEQPQYEKTLRLFEGADFLVISDFAWGSLSQEVRKLLDEKRQNKIRFYALGVNTFFDGSGGVEEDFEECRSGIDFFQRCDCRFIYDNMDGLKQL